MKQIDKPSLPTFYMSSIFNMFEDDNGFQFFNILKRININVDNFDDTNVFTPYTFKPGDSYTSIAFEFYGDINLWWLICVVNKIDNPFKKPDNGLRIYLLNRGYTIKVLDSLNSNG